MSELKGLKEAQALWDWGEKIKSIKLLCERNEGLDLFTARKAVDPTYKAEIEADDISVFLAESGHPLAPNEPVIEKIKNLVAIIKAQGEIFEYIASLIPEDLELMGVERVDMHRILFKIIYQIQNTVSPYKK